MCNVSLQRLMKNDITATALMSRFLLPPCADNLTSWKTSHTTVCIICLANWSYVANCTSVMCRIYTDTSFQQFQLQKNLDPVTNYSLVHNSMFLTLLALRTFNMYSNKCSCIYVCNTMVLLAAKISFSWWHVMNEYRPSMEWKWQGGDESV